jgi:hypothetical protein
MTHEQWLRLAIAWERYEDDPTPENRRAAHEANEEAR